MGYQRFSPENSTTPPRSTLGVKLTDRDTGSRRVRFWKFSDDVDDLLLGSDQFLGGDADTILAEAAARFPGYDSNTTRAWPTTDGICVVDTPLAFTAILNPRRLARGVYVLGDDAAATVAAIAATAGPLLVYRGHYEQLRREFDRDGTPIVVASGRDIRLDDGTTLIEIRHDAKRYVAACKGQATRRRHDREKRDRVRAFERANAAAHLVVDTAVRRLNADGRRMIAATAIPSHSQVTLQFEPCYPKSTVSGRLAAWRRIVAQSRLLLRRPPTSWAAFRPALELAAAYHRLPAKPWTREEQDQIGELTEDDVVQLRRWHATFQRHSRRFERQEAVHPAATWNLTWQSGLAQSETPLDLSVWNRAFFTADADSAADFTVPVARFGAVSRYLVLGPSGVDPRPSRESLKTWLTDSRNADDSVELWDALPRPWFVGRQVVTTVRRVVEPLCQALDQTP